jgi:hypothetical protein
LSLVIELPAVKSPASCPQAVRPLNQPRRLQLRKSVVFIVAFVALGCIAQEAWGRTRVFHASIRQLRAACDRVGGSFDTFADGSGAVCINDNCDHRGGSCIVACNSNEKGNNCQGETPNRTKTVIVGGRAGALQVLNRRAPR